MIKKLFISFLLLSSLTSEGLINLPYGIYSFYFGTGFSDTCKLTSMHSSVRQVAKSQFLNQSEKSRLTSKGIRPDSIKTYPSSISQCLNWKQAFEGFTFVSFNQSNFSPSKEILTMSDSSPPKYQI